MRNRSRPVKEKRWLIELREERNPLNWINLLNLLELMEMPLMIGLKPRAGPLDQATKATKPEKALRTISDWPIWPLIKPTHRHANKHCKLCLISDAALTLSWNNMLLFHRETNKSWSAGYYDMTRHSMLRWLACSRLILDEGPLSDFSSIRCLWASYRLRTMGGLTYAPEKNKSSAHMPCDVVPPKPL